jgi:hypothetical protein
LASRTVKVVVLCEGIEDYDFARRALIRLGWNRRLFEPRISPPGNNGKLFVTQSYPAELKAQRARQGVKLLVCTDADEHSVSERARQLATALQAVGEPPRRDGECVAHWIPRWHLETWVYLYTRGPIDEDTDYKRQVSESDHQDAAIRFGDDLKRRSIAPRRCASLERALAETDRIRGTAKGGHRGRRT